MGFTVLSLVMCCCQVAEDGLSASKPGAITAAAATLVSEMSNVNQVSTGVQYKPCCFDCRIGSAVFASLYVRVCIASMRACVRACACFHINCHHNERRRIMYCSQLIRLYRYARVVSVLVKRISTKCLSCPRRSFF